MLNSGEGSEQNLFSHSSSKWDCVGMCSPGLQPGKDDETREAKGCQEMSGVVLFPYISFSHPLYSLTCSSPPYSHGHKQPVWSGFRFCLPLVSPSVDQAYCAPSKPLFGLLPLSVTLSLFRKCWTSAKTEGAVKSLSTAACLGQTSVLAAVNTSLSGTNADLVSPSSPQILTVTHIFCSPLNWDSVCSPVFSHTSRFSLKYNRWGHQWPSHGGLISTENVHLYKIYMHCGCVQQTEHL